MGYEIVKGELRVTGDAIVCGDFHAPQHNWRVLEDIIAKGKSNGIRQLIINGDLMNQDSFSTFDKKDSSASFGIEAPELSIIGDRLAENFERIFFVEGNHDIRASKKTGYLITPEMILKMILSPEAFNNFVITDRDYLILNNDWRICHSREYSRYFGQKAQKIGLKYDMNVILGHSHVGSETYHCEVDPNRAYSKERYYIDGFCCLNFEKVNYELNNTSTFTNWSNGFVIMKNGKPMIRAYQPPKIIDYTHKEYNGYIKIVRKQLWDGRLMR